MALTFKNKVSLAAQLKKMPSTYPIPEYTGDICVDVGCNQGAFSIYAHTRFRKILAVEPGQDAISNAKENIRARGITNVEFKQAGVSNERNKTLQLRYHPNTKVERNCDASTEIDEFYSDLGTEYEEVPSITLPEIRDWAEGIINYLKVDCEGAEYKFLMDQDLRNIDYLAMEIHNQLGPTKIHELRSYLEKYFKVSRKRYGTPQRHLEIFYKRRSGL